MSPEPPERWLPVPGWEGLYEVSDLGRVRSIARPTVKGIRGGRMLKLAVSKGRYRYAEVTLCRSGEQKRHMVHRLVLAAFVGPLVPGMQTRHGPGGKLDNRLANLSYGTPGDNQHDRSRDGTVSAGERNPMAKLTTAAVAEIRRRVAAGEVQRSLAREYQVSPAAICMLVSGTTWRHP